MENRHNTTSRSQMGFLKLGVNCAVINDEGEVLLSRRGDLKVWNLPGGRLDEGETLAEATLREVREETGVVVNLERAVGLYYLAGWQRLNVLFTGWPLGGDLKQRTPETRANQYFAPDNFPDMMWAVMPLDALAGTRHKPRMLQMSPSQLRQTKLRLRLRWLTNLLTGRPELAFPRFEVNAVGVIWDETYRRVLTFSTDYGRQLPRITCLGASAPWEELADTILQFGESRPAFRWVGLWQDVSRSGIEFIFAATMEETELARDAEWSLARNSGLNDRDADYVNRVKPSYARDAVWTIIHDPEVRHGEALATKGRAL